MIAGVLVIAFFAFSSSKLPFQFVNGHIDTPISVLTRLGPDKNLAVLGPCDDLDRGTIALAGVHENLDLVNAVVVLGQLGRFVLRVISDCFRNFDVFAADCEKQNQSP
jgi:hypothetical protein